MHNLYLLARTMIIKRYWRSSTYVVVCAIASDNAIKISNPTESFKIQTKAVVWPAKIKVIQDYNVRLNKKKMYKMWGVRIQWHWVRTYPYWLSKFQKIKNPLYLMKINFLAKLYKIDIWQNFEEYNSCPYGFTTRRGVMSCSA